MIVIKIVNFKRKVGPFNLVTIPAEILATLNIKIGDKLNVYLRDENSFVIEVPNANIKKSIDIRFVRKVTSHGRIVIPCELEPILNASKWEYANIYLRDENSIIVERFKEE